MAVKPGRRDHPGAALPEACFSAEIANLREALKPSFSVAMSHVRQQAITPRPTARGRAGSHPEARDLTRVRTLPTPPHRTQLHTPRVTGPGATGPSSTQPASQDPAPQDPAPQTPRHRTGQMPTPSARALHALALPSYRRARRSLHPAAGKAPLARKNTRRRLLRNRAEPQHRAPPHLPAERRHGLQEATRRSALPLFPRQALPPSAVRIPPSRWQARARGRRVPPRPRPCSSCRRRPAFSSSRALRPARQKHSALPRTRSAPVRAVWRVGARVRRGAGLPPRSLAASPWRALPALRRPRPETRSRKLRVPAPRPPGRLVCSPIVTPAFFFKCPAVDTSE